MGYYTDYRFEVYKPDDNITAYEILNKMIEMKKNNNKAFYPFQATIDELISTNWTKKEHDFELETDDNCKWYDWKDEVFELSKYFPKVIFQIYGKGEEQGDIWKAWIKNEKVIIHEAKIVIDPLDEKEFK